MTDWKKKLLNLQQQSLSAELRKSIHEARKIQRKATLNSISFLASTSTRFFLFLLLLASTLGITDGNPIDISSFEPLSVVCDGSEFPPHHAAIEATTTALQNEQQIIPTSVTFLHGLEGGHLGSKHRYLINNFKTCYFRSMEMSKWKLWKRNGFTRSLLRNWFRPSLAAEDSLEGCLSIQAEELTKHRPDIIIGSSWGGAIGLLLLSEGLWEGPIVLIAPALKHLLEWVGGTPKFKWEEIVNRINAKDLGRHIVIVHGKNDKVIPYQNSVDAVQTIHGAQLITVNNGKHALTDYLISRDNLRGIIINRFNKSRETLNRNDERETINQQKD